MSNDLTDKKCLNDFFKTDQGLNRCAPKVTVAHIHPGHFQNIKVCYAAQVFSATVAAGMRNRIINDTLSSTANTTVNFIDDMDKLYDQLNSKPKAGSKDFNRPLKNIHKQREHLLKMFNIFKNMLVMVTKIINRKTVLIDVTQRIKFLNG